jgi:OTU domain-containing protein 3
MKTATPKMAPIQDWMIKNIMTATPHLFLDEATIRKKLEENGGQLDTTLSKLLDSGYLSSNPPSPGSYSQSGSSSIERDVDSDDDGIYAPNKRQNRRMSRASKTSRKSNCLATNIDFDLQAIPTIELTEPDSQISSKLPPPSRLPPLSQLPVKSELPEPSSDVEEAMTDEPTARKTKKVRDEDDWAPSDDDNEDEFKPDDDNDAASTYSASSSSAFVSFGTTPPQQRITIKLNTRTNKSMQKQHGPQKKKPSARERKDLKKAAQKQARKESKRNNATLPQLAASTTSINQNRNRDSPPMEQVIGMKTLYI